MLWVPAAPYAILVFLLGVPSCLFLRKLRPEIGVSPLVPTALRSELARFHGIADLTACMGSQEIPGVIALRSHRRHRFQHAEARAHGRLWAPMVLTETDGRSRSSHRTRRFGPELRLFTPLAISRRVPVSRMVPASSAFRR